MKQLFHSRLLDMRLVIANSALRASLVIYHLISNARSWNNCFSIYTESVLNNIFRRKPLRIGLMDFSIHAWKTCK